MIMRLNCSQGRIHGIVKEAEELAEKGRIVESEKKMGQVGRYRRPP